MYVRMCVYVCTYVCMYVSMFVRMCVCIDTYVHILLVCVSTSPSAVFYFILYCCFMFCFFTFHSILFYFRTFWWPSSYAVARKPKHCWQNRTRKMYSGMCVCPYLCVYLCCVPEIVIMRNIVFYDTLPNCANCTTLSVTKWYDITLTGEIIIVRISRFSLIVPSVMPVDLLAHATSTMKLSHVTSCH